MKMKNLVNVMDPRLHMMLTASINRREYSFNFETGKWATDNLIKPDRIIRVIDFKNSPICTTYSDSNFVTFSTFFTHKIEALKDCDTYEGKVVRIVINPITKEHGKCSKSNKRRDYEYKSEIRKANKERWEKYQELLKSIEKEEKESAENKEENENENVGV